VRAGARVKKKKRARETESIRCVSCNALLSVYKSLLSLYGPVSSVDGAHSDSFEGPQLA